MKKAELIVGYMDKLKAFIEFVDSYLDLGLEFLHKAKVYIQKIIELIQKGVDYLVENMGGRPDNQIGDDYLFV
ncbi:MAG: hypothetical protein ITG00_02000 [Flavobacterium sp.]|nr:hypothetical protein [Flavobacterium sp.]